METLPARSACRRPGSGPHAGEVQPRPGIVYARDDADPRSAGADLSPWHWAVLERVAGGLPVWNRLALLSEREADEHRTKHNASA